MHPFPASHCANRLAASQALPFVQYPGKGSSVSGPPASTSGGTQASVDVASSVDTSGMLPASPASATWTEPSAASVPAAPSRDSASDFMTSPPHDAQPTRIQAMALPLARQCASIPERTLSLSTRQVPTPVRRSSYWSCWARSQDRRRATCQAHTRTPPAERALGQFRPGT